ncbi:Auxin Efflux Carrier [Alkaliphilus metalliredigens QYMF]|uniref:Auxin Efflux Carrier n=1 Tax=Alkaliphilus metalliredigens (strain QYMF) TaxID=293826 RepID=A6TTK6_ALKMQ|nr:AEC family transporter [Alkaliphilus metalliredigens]ABR49524.1 Auxin Efflux Carrier [Alkaliphilus metalliredigens QYMF]
MNVFLFILTNNITPILVLITLGYLMNKKFDLNIQTLTKFNFYIFVPAFTFVNLYTTKIPVEMIKVVVTAVLIMGINMSVASLTSKIRGYDEGLKNAFTNSAIFFNAGNIGIPLITLVFSSVPFVINGQTPYLELALTAQIMMLVVQNITANTIGFLNAGRANTDWKKSLGKVLGMPTIYAVPLALILKTIPYDMTQVAIWPALDYARNALVPTSLLTLGVQLSRTAFEFKNKEVYLSVIIRLLGGPILALIFIYLFGMNGIIAQVVMISSALPTAVNTALIAVEYDNYPDFASQAVMTSTLFSSVSLVFVIYMARMIFPMA